MAKSREEYREEARKQAELRADNIRLELEAYGQISAAHKKHLEDLYEMNIAKDAYVELLRQQGDVEDENRDELEKAIELQKQQAASLMAQTSQYEDQTKHTQRINLNLGSMWSFLMEADSAIKSMNREFGLAVERSDMLRGNIEEAAVKSAMMGATIKDITAGYSTYVNETGRVVELSDMQLEKMVAIGKATNLGVDGAAKLAGQFEIMGITMERTAQLVEGSLESSERLGVNATKVLQRVGESFDRMQTFTFQRGVNSMIEMAQFSEKFKLDINTALASAEKARRLDSAIDMMAKLQVMGGEFAKTDPFEMLFLSRNDPAKYAEKIEGMTRGIASFRQLADGTFENFISPVDIDRLNIAAEAMGMQGDELIKIARRSSLIGKARQEMIGTGLSDEEMKYVENLGQLDQDTGKLFVMISGTRKAMMDLTTDDIRRLESERESIEARAKRAQNFDEVFTATIEEFKSLLLPVLQGVNSMLRWTNEHIIMPMTEALSDTPDWAKTIMKYAGMFLGVGALLTKLTPLGSVMAKFLPALGGLFGGAGAVGGGLMKGLSSGIGALANPATLIGLAALDATFLALGYSLKMAGEGMQGLSASIVNLNENVTGGELMDIALGLGAITAALSVGTAAGGLLKFFGSTDSLVNTINEITASAGDLQTVGDAFNEIYNVLSAPSDQFDNLKTSLDSISNMEVGKLSFVSELNEVLSKPLKVEFADKNVAINIQLDNYMDGKKITDTLNITRRVELQLDRYKKGKGAPKGTDST